MYRTSFGLMLGLVASFAPAAQGGWHHRHAAYQAAPVYYAAPAFMPAFAQSSSGGGSSAQSALGDIIIAKLVDKLIGSIDKVDIGPKTTEPADTGSKISSSDLAALQSSINELKASVKDLDARVENANSALAVHGTSLIAIQEKLEGLKADVDASSNIRKAAEKTLLSTKTLGEIEAALSKPEFKTAADAYKVAPATPPNKAIDDLKAAVQGLLTP